MLKVLRSTHFISECRAIAIIAPFLFLTACLSTESLTPQSTSGSITSSFLGCIDGVGVSASQIRVNFEFPSGAEKVNIYRNGSIAYSTSSPTSLAFVDTGLQEGAEYEYSCEAVKSKTVKVGTRVLTLSTISTNPPTFSGITGSTVLSATTNKVTWNPPSSLGPVAKTYKVYANPGTTVNWALTPRATVSAGTYEYTLTSLGDQLPYSFGVRACTSNNNCDTNVVEIDKTQTDNGAPQTNGASLATANNSAITLTVPWQEIHGAVYKRKVYQRTGAVGGTNLADYTLVKTEVSVDLANPATSISIPGVVDNTTYHYIVQDEDPSGVSNNNLTVLTITAGDLTPPLFAGISTLVQGAPSETVLTAGFNAIAREGTGDAGAVNGATNYVFMANSLAFPGTPADPCTSGSTILTVPASGYPPGAATVDITGLTSRTNYRVCIKAVDASGNTSVVTTFLTQNTNDVTAPSWDGLQTLTYNSTTQQLDLTWNQSSSTDRYEYKIRMWKNTTTPAAGDITTFLRSDATYSSGTNITSVQFPFVDADIVYAVVDACDDASTLPGGVQNCTSTALTAYKSTTIPDVTPPVGFLGIKGPGDQLTPAEGQITVKWFEPAWTADYHGFRVYYVTGGTTLNFVKDCACATPGSCNAGDTQCTVTGLNALRTYRMHVRAYDAFGNVTTLDPTSSYADVTTTDTTVPTFTSSLNLGSSPTFPLTWAAASDNQYTGSITYKVYQRIGATFTTATNPTADLDTNLRTTTALTTFTDTGYIQGDVYYYTICAVDSSNNTKCDGQVRNFTAPDVTAPSITNLTSTHSSLKKTWDLNWTMSDAVSANANINVKVYKTTTATASTATTSDALIYNTNGVQTVTGLTGPTYVGTSAPSGSTSAKYVNYLVLITDQAGNTASATLSVFSNNDMSITSVNRNRGVGSGLWITIKGTGFSLGSENGYGTGTTVTIAGNTCTDVGVVSSTTIVCKTPANTNGAKSVAVINPEGSSYAKLSAYTYDAAPVHICDDTGSWGADFAAGVGTVGNPFQICSKAQWYKMNQTAVNNYLNTGYYFKLSDNIDFDGTAYVPIQSAWNGQLDGQNHALLNMSYSNGGTNHVGAFAYISYSPTPVLIKDLVLYNYSFTGAQWVGGLVGFADMRGASISSIDNIVAKGTVVGTANVGGIIGAVDAWGYSDRGISNLYSDVSVTSSSRNNGGIVGGMSGGFITNAETKGSLTCSITPGEQGCGGIAGSMSATDISNVTSSVAIDGRDQGGNGGIVGLGSTSNARNIVINNANFTGSITSTAAGWGQLGGIVGQVNTGTSNFTISNSYNTGSITGAATTTAVGGIIGLTLGGTSGASLNIINSYNTGNISGQSNVGGLVGYCWWTYSMSISKSYNTGNITLFTGGTYAGGIVGSFGESDNETTNISEVYSTGDVTAQGTAYGIGGIVGYWGGAGASHTSTFADCWASGNLTSSNTVGGIVADASFGGAATTRTMNRCFYASGVITGAVSNTRGGVYGSLWIPNHTFNGAGLFYNSTTSGMTVGLNTGGGGSTPPTITGKTTTEMQNQAADIYAAAGYDFTPVTGKWKWCAASGVYPVLMYQTCP